MAEIEIRLSEDDLTKLADMIAARVSPRGGDQNAGKLLWTEDEAAAVLGVSRFSLKRWRQDGYISASASSKPILYSRDHLEQAAEWISERKCLYEQSEF
ncbi:MAG: helix-turn-helix domain-containing protein [Pirellulaceae bacterium]